MLNRRIRYLIQSLLLKTYWTLLRFFTSSWWIVHILEFKLCESLIALLSVTPGVGDFTVSDVSFLPDPCALPEQQKKRSLSEKEKLIYAPLSGVGGIVYDKDAVYIDLGGSHAHENKEVKECCWYEFPSLTECSFHL